MVGGKSNIGKEKIGRIVKQGVFLLQCMIKWYVTTGRRPVPVVVAVIVFVCEVNDVEISMEDLASQLNVVVGTCKLRYKELLKRLVEVARENLPWGNDVNVRNIMKNAPTVIQYLEVKSTCNCGKEDKSLEEIGLNLEVLVSDCLNQKGDMSLDSTDWEIEDLENLNVSPETSEIYLKYLDDYSNMKASTDMIEDVRSKRSDLLVDMPEYWSGNSELSKKLFLIKYWKKMLD